jgi:hypothetical protein
MNISHLEDKIKAAYESGVTLDEAEKLASEFLSAMIGISEDLRSADLSSRMRKTALKAVKAAVYMNEATKTDKKPTESMLAALIDKNEIVQSEQESFDKVEVERDALERTFNILREAHLHFRAISKGRFDG